MGSCGSGIGGIGPIVWVRRRNGSWWPGKILSPNELSESNLNSPRTGTPVKLLGREDASVDWYNLEKSKRVKAFRCGEFDECIEKAESAHGLPIKKREKYARREDAILHALELEKALGSNRLTSSLSSDKKVSLANNDVVGIHSMTKFFQDSGADFENLNSVEITVMEEDNPEETPKMRELQDLGVKTAPTKRKYATHEHENSSRNNHLPIITTSSTEKMVYTNGELTGVSSRPKRLRIDKKDFSNLSHPRLKGPRDVKDEASYSSQSESLDTDFDSSETEPDTNDISVSSEANVQESTSIEEANDYLDDPYLASEAVSKWQLKGKRNIRNPSPNGEIYNLMRNGSKASTFRRKGGYNLPCPSRKEGNFLDWDEISKPLGRSHSGGRTRGVLVDVDLKVQASYKRESVPLISLLSKVNGMAIVGNPIQITITEDGALEGIIPNNEHILRNPSLPVAWKTARRRNFRVPRSNVASVLGIEDSCDLMGQSSSFLKKGSTHSPRSLVDKKFSRKGSKKASVSSNQKTRTLSSIGAKSVDDGDGRTKGEVAGTPTVACIPVKLVFSRLLEKINRAPSKVVGCVN